MQRLNEHLKRFIHPVNHEPIITDIKYIELAKDKLYSIHYKTTIKTTTIIHQMLIEDSHLKDLTSPEAYKKLVRNAEHSNENEY